jgi:hypothetical protein
MYIQQNVWNLKKDKEIKITLISVEETLEVEVNSADEDFVTGR